MSFVSIRNLRVAFDGVQVLHGIDLDIGHGEAVGLVGESGCGKSVTWLAALGLLPGKAKIEGSVTIEGQELIGAPRTGIEAVRGARIAMIFQDPSSSLNPVHRVGRQICESLRLHRGLRGDTARTEAIRLLDMVGIPSARTRIDLYPHEFSGGQCQRVLIAMALAGEPDLLVADEPTTALDATIQAQILDLLSNLRRQTGMAMVFISHDLGAVSTVCDRAAVMYAGRIVEENDIGRLFVVPRHPYTRGLFDAIPELDAGRARLHPIPGTVPDPRQLPQGCAFSPRCTAASRFCKEHQPDLRAQPQGGLLACFHPDQVRAETKQEVFA
ncbi:ABC transporter ATP-binding protein [Paracoccus siganidrum]|uniref:ABC transporter ATP-binding protein n=1 Tax=Paracoccus siganidrum TaxID=1276757 RepID=A0A418ZYV7_9RHOB|nr:ABC transporter ATP-binding protein [Paracoccus siganidrum]RJL05729.1 ABC transporter ATP-binding protein [Paracoccus siganidrum]RMC27000.1 ABC transporter ATP-binding protein [Paracoccus siganidrum]